MANSLSTLLQLAALPALTTPYGLRQEGLNIQDVLADGNLIGQANKAYVAQRSVTNSSTPDLVDLNGGSVIGLDGAVFSITRLVMLIIRNIEVVANVNNVLSVGGGSNSPTWLPQQSIGGPSGVLVKYVPTLAGLVVTPGSGDIVQVVTAAGSVVPYVMIAVGS